MKHLFPFPIPTRLSLLLLALICLLPACRPQPTEPSQAFSLAAPTATIRPAEKPLAVIGRFVGDDEIQMRALLERFTAKTGIEVQYKGSGEVATLLLEEVEAERTPDVLLLPKAHWVTEMASAGAISPLSEEVATTVRAHFGAAWLARVSYEGSLYGVPFDANAKSLLWYRPAVFGEVAFDPPQALETLFTLAGEMERQGEVPFVVAGGAGWLLTDWFENILLAHSGLEVYDALITHQIPWTDARVEAAARQYASLLRDTWVMGGNHGATTLPLDPDTFGQAFAPTQKGAVFWLGQGSIANSFAATNQLMPGRDYDLFAFPAQKTMIVIGSMAVATNDAPETMALLHFLAEPEAVEAWVETGTFVSPNQLLPLERYPTQQARREAELLAQAEHLRADLSDRLPPNLGFPYLGDQLRQMLESPDEIPAILVEIEEIATREQGKSVSGWVAD